MMRALSFGNLTVCDLDLVSLGGKYEVINSIIPGLNVGYPTLPSCSLELIDPITWRTIDGWVSPRFKTARYWIYLLGSYEFATNEVINVVQSVTLETLSTEAGNKDFIAVATSVHRGEDLAVRGAVRIFIFASLLGAGVKPEVWHEC